MSAVGQGRHTTAAMTDDGPLAAFERIERPVFALDPAWRFVYLNDAAREFLAGSDLEGDVIWDALPGVMDTGLPETFHEARTAGETRRTTVPMGDDRRIEFQAFPGDDEELTVLMQDVTERYRQRQHRERYEAAFTAADDPIYVLDGEGRMREVNDAMVELTGYDREALLGRSMALLLDPEEMERAERRIRETVLEGDESVGTIETTVETAAGERRSVAVSVALLPEDHPVTGTVGVIRDVTDRRRREQRLAVLDRVLRHNIRNEMTVVMGQAQVAERKASDEVVDHLEKIEAKAQELTDVSQAVRRFSDALDPDLGTARPRDTVDVVTSTVEDLREEHDADIAVTVREPAWMRAHESVTAAIEEVVRNAVVHVEDRDPEVWVTVDATGPPGEGEVVVEVADNGPGLPEAERKVLTGGEQTQLTHASGIGLWLVNWAVTKSGGGLSFDENDPRGSVVTVRLPRVAPPDDGTADAATDREAG